MYMAWRYAIIDHSEILKIEKVIFHGKADTAIVTKERNAEDTVLDQVPEEGRMATNKRPMRNR